MTFTHPEAFYLLIVAALFVATAVYNYGKKRKLLNQFLSSAAAKRLSIRSGAEIDFFKTGLVTLALCCFILALAGPQWGEQVENLEFRGIEMLFLLDTSASMNAEDLKPNRLDVSKQLIRSVVDKLETDFVGLVNFAGAAYIQCPLTVDYEAFKLLVDASPISPAEAQGTDLGEAFRIAVASLQKAAGDKKLLILITDGEDHENLWQTWFEPLNEQKVIIFTVGVGVAAGAPIPIKDSDGNFKNWKKDKEGNIIKTSLDENSLLQIASRTGGQYFRLADISGIDLFVDTLKKFERDVLKKKIRMKKINRYYIPLLAGLLFLFLELLLSEKRLTWQKNN